MFELAEQKIFLANYDVWDSERFKKSKKQNLGNVNKHTKHIHIFNKPSLL